MLRKIGQMIKTVCLNYLQIDEIKPVYPIEHGYKLFYYRLIYVITYKIREMIYG